MLPPQTRPAEPYIAANRPETARSALTDPRNTHQLSNSGQVAAWPLLRASSAGCGGCSARFRPHEEAHAVVRRALRVVGQVVRMAVSLYAPTRAASRMPNPTSTVEPRFPHHAESRRQDQPDQPHGSHDPVASTKRPEEGILIGGSRASGRAAATTWRRSRPARPATRRPAGSTQPQSNVGRTGRAVTRDRARRR